MNLEYDDEELEILRTGGEFFAKIAPNPAIGTLEPPATWAALVDTGWSNLGAELSSGDLPLAMGVDLFRRGGSQLLTEELVTSAFLLSMITTAIVDPGIRRDVINRLGQRPGLILGDGRSRFLPLASEDTVTGLCFGSAGKSDLYRVIARPHSRFLQYWTGPSPRISPLGGLSPSATMVSVDTGTGAWIEAAVEWDEAGLAAVERQAALLHSAALVGCAERLLQLSCQYAIDRVQFGVPIGSFQAVKHLLADVHTALAVAWNAILSAAAQDADPALSVPVARLLAVDGALAAARVGAQVHGGLGFTAEANVHLFMKAILDGSMRGGGPDEVAVELGRRFLEAQC